MKKLVYVFALLFLSNSYLHSQISAPTSIGTFPTEYSAVYISGGGSNDWVYIFCGDAEQNDIGELEVSAGGCDVVWHVYDESISNFVELGQTGQTASGLTSGFYMATVDCGGTITCYRAWVWVNQTLVDVHPIDPGCETFTLEATVDAMDTEFVIHDPPELDFVIDENTFVQVCFWANHTYVSDLGFYLKAPGHHNEEPGGVGVVELLPSPSAWNTNLPWDVTGCDPSDQATPCNNGNHLDEFCFSTNLFPGGPEMEVGNPNFVPCVCDMETPLQGIFASAGPWDGIYGFNAAQDGWAVQVYDCEFVDFGVLTQVRISFVGESECGLTSIVYESGDISVPINDDSCDAESASIYVVPPGEPAGQYTVTSEITNYSWSCTGSTFSGNQLSHVIQQGTADFPSQTSDFILTVTQSINVPGGHSCQISDSETFETLPVNATITEVDPVCANSSPFLLQTVDGGGTWSTNAPEGSIQGNTFYPGIANEGVWDLTYSIGGPCPDEDQISITVYESIEVQNFSDLVCDGNDENFFIEFDVVSSSGGSPSGFWVDHGSGNQWYTGGSYNEMFPSPTAYSLTITDDNGCNYIVIDGFRDCGCTTYAGTMNSTQLINLCEGECTDAISHNGNQVLDGNDVLQFILHDGSQYPAQILAVNNNDPYFCFNQIPDGQYGQTYYVSAIAGNNDGSNNVDQSDFCYSQSPGTPVVWHKNPIAHIEQNNFTTCGLSTILQGNEPEVGVGTWTANESFVPLGGYSVNDPTINVLVNEFETVDFTWTVANNLCESSDVVSVTFSQGPNAFAGNNFVVCGSSADLNAVLSLPASTGQWSGPGSFSSQSDPNATVSVSNYGTYTFVWREFFADCDDQDYVTVTFLEEPNPSTIVNVDTVCGLAYNLNAVNTKYPGSWSATVDGEPYAVSYDDVNSPNTIAIITNYEGLYIDVEFTWTETNQSGAVECIEETSILVTFAKQPVASVGVDVAEVCGYCFTFDADTTGSGWAEGTWINKDNIIAEFMEPGPNIPNATVCIDSLGSFGDSAYVKVEFIWVMQNYGCTSIDTMTVYFYNKPSANAGLDNAVCGNDYNLGAVYSFPPTESYDPYGAWTVAQRPVSHASADWSPDFIGDSVGVTVSHYGIWKFRFRENNANNSSCFSADTVTIEFVEQPIIDAGDDKDVCGQTTNLEATSSTNFSGSWLPNGASYVDPSDPTTQTSVNSYGPLDYIWLESNSAETTSLSCTSIDTVTITFFRQPTSVILTDDADSTTCGLKYNNLRAQSPSSGITGSWYNETDPDPDFADVNSHNTSVTVSGYGYHDFYWITANGPTYQPDFCNDTAGPLRIHFIEIPTANAGGDTLFCGKSGNLNAIPSVGTGVWSTPSSDLISFDNENDPNALITSEVHSSSSNPYFNLIWTEDNTNECTDRDTIKVRFARIPNSEIYIVPPKCPGEQAIISAVEDSLQQYDWNFTGGIIDTTNIGTNAQGGKFEKFVHWFTEDTAHRVTLMVTNYWGCQSSVTIDSVFEPAIPDFDVIMVGDTCLLGKGGIIFQDTLGQSAFYWLNDEMGPPFDSPITAVYNLPVGEYDVRARYRTVNTFWSGVYNSIFGNDRCADTVTYEIEPIGLIYAEFELAPDVILSELVAPEAEVWFNNSSDYGGVNRRCVWHFGDGNTLISCDEQVTHTYEEPGCFEPFLIVMNRDLQQCRDTAYIDICVPVDQASDLEVPNVFTPDGDGINDYFQVKAQTLRSFQGYILNRWGTVVYEWTNWEDEDAGWDGKMSGGTNAAPGVYFYVIRAVGMDDVEYEKQGHLHLIRD